MDIEGEMDRQLWDERWWTYALKTEQPVENYNKLTSEHGESPPSIDDLPPERQAWYRNR